MRYRTLGASGLKVSPLCLGTMMFGGPTDEATATRIVAKAKEQGVNFIDTADGYNGGKSEEVTGRAIGNQRDDWVLATKLGNVRGNWPNHGGLSRKWVIQCCRGEPAPARHRLHRHPLPAQRGSRHAARRDGARARPRCMRDGKIRYFGVSNHRGWRIAEICNLCDQMGIDRPIVNQPYYHALYRVAEVEQLPACAHYGIGVVSYSPLARGVLTGKYQPGAEAAKDSRAGRADKRMLRNRDASRDAGGRAESSSNTPTSAASRRAISRSPGC